MAANLSRTVARWVVLLLGIPVLFIVAIHQTGARDAGLFEDLPYEYKQVDLNDPAVIRARYVRPNFDLLPESDPASVVGSLQFNLFADAIYNGTIDRIERNSSGSLTWTGRLEAIPFSSFTLVTRNGMMMGTVKIPGGFYRIAYIQDGVHAILELDDGAFPPELAPIPVELTRDSGSPSSPTVDDGSLIDVLVVYTEAARQSVGDGSVDAIETLIDTAVAETNTGYANSGVSQRLNLTHTAEVFYSETSFNWSSTLYRLSHAGDGFLDEVYPLRENYCADTVVLLVGNSDSCGIAYVMNILSTSFADVAFSVVSTYCATGNYSFGHELGHNMGSAHDRANASVLGVYDYSFGYQDPAPYEAFRTIMAYNCPSGCTRLNYWSNPEILWDGRPMGVVYTDPLAADNRRSLNNTASTVANFKDSAQCAPAFNISGDVRTPSGSGINGVSVDFSGIRPPVNTNSDGHYNQTGFTDGEYTLSFMKSGYSFSPVKDLVSISGSDAIHDATGYLFNPVGIPFNEDFESGSLGDYWAIETDYEGRVRVDPTYPNLGTYSLNLDHQDDGETYSHAAAILALDLSGQTQVDLSFWWREFSDEEHADDGVFLSDDGGNTWHLAYSFNGQTDAYKRTAIDLDSTANAAGMSLTDNFLVKFQFYDNRPAPLDGYAIDDIWVSAPVGPLVYDGQSIQDKDLNEGGGDGDGIAECGESIELTVSLTNQGLALAAGVTTTLNTTDPYITFPYNTTSSYPDIPGGGTADNDEPFEIVISSEIPDGYNIPFSLNITALNGGPWVDDFYLTAGCSRIFTPLVTK